MILSPDSTNRSEAWYTKSPSDSYALTKLFWPVSSLIMRPNATKSSIASFAASLITWPMPFMMAQISRKYSTNISIVSTFLSLKVSHFSWDSQGSCRLSAHQEVSRKYGQPLYRSAAISPQCSFPSMLKLRYYETQNYSKSEIHIVRVLHIQILLVSETYKVRNSYFYQIR